VHSGGLDLPAASGLTGGALSLETINHDPRNAAFYQPEGLKMLTVHLHPGGVFGL
jgi:hypothetical protein